MSSSSRLVDLSLSAFAAQVASPSPTPGSGSSAAALGAIGAALVSMAFRRTAGEGHAAAEVYGTGRADELDLLRERLLELVDIDAESYSKLILAQRQPGDPDHSTQERAARLAEALDGALECPLEIQESALAALRIACVGALDSDPRRDCELELGALALAAACRGVLPVVEVDAGALADRAVAAERTRVARWLASEAERLGGEVRAILARRGDPAATRPAGSSATRSS
jgi:formiminotetrahydrofolate cyclodeaminase